MPMLQQIDINTHLLTLGLADGNPKTEAEIVQAYNALERDRDRNRGNDAAEEQFQQINEAYSALISHIQNHASIKAVCFGQVMSPNELMATLKLPLDEMGRQNAAQPVLLKQYELEKAAELQANREAAAQAMAEEQRAHAAFMADLTARKAAEQRQYEAKMRELDADEAANGVPSASTAAPSPASAPMPRPMSEEEFQATLQRQRETSKAKIRREREEAQAEQRRKDAELDAELRQKRVAAAASIYVDSAIARGSNRVLNAHHKKEMAELNRKAAEEEQAREAEHQAHMREMAQRAEAKEEREQAAHVARMREMEAEEEEKQAAHEQNMQARRVQHDEAMAKIAAESLESNIANIVRHIELFLEQTFPGERAADDKVKFIQQLNIENTGQGSDSVRDLAAHIQSNLLEDFNYQTMAEEFTTKAFEFATKSLQGNRSPEQHPFTAFACGYLYASHYKALKQVGGEDAVTFFLTGVLNEQHRWDDQFTEAEFWEGFVSAPHIANAFTRTASGISEASYTANELQPAIYYRWVTLPDSEMNANTKQMLTLLCRAVREMTAHITTVERNRIGAQWNKQFIKINNQDIQVSHTMNALYDEMTSLLTANNKADFIQKVKNIKECIESAQPKTACWWGWQYGRSQETVNTYHLLYEGDDGLSLLTDAMLGLELGVAP